MPRGPRVRLAGVPLHIIQRGNNRGPCFFTDSDYLYYLDHLGQLASRFGCAIHAYVLMTNHVHLLLTPEHADSASHLMRHLGQRYVQFVNRRHGRTGTLWEGRFRSSFVQGERYLLCCHRYIELNPIRARMVKSPGDYRWSSYRANAMAATNTLLTPHEEYLRLGGDSYSRISAYRALVEIELNEIDIHDIRKAANTGHVLGVETFVREIERATGRRLREGRPGRPGLKSIDEIPEIQWAGI